MPYASPAAKSQAASDRLSARRALFIQQAGGKCACGSTEDLGFSAVVDGERRGRIQWTWSLERIARQIEGRPLQCKSCRQGGQKHGTAAGWRNGCRCETCQGWKAQDRKRDRMRKRGGKPASSPLAPLPFAPARPPLPSSREREEVWARMVVKMIARQRMRVEVGEWAGPRAA